MTEGFNPYNVDDEAFAALLAVIASHPPDCECDTCTFVNLIPAILDATGVEPD